MRTREVAALELRDRFWSKVDCDTDDQCWGWKASKNNSGYGDFNYLNKHWLAHRASYQLEIGHIPEDKDIHHLCDNRLCVNPLHLIAVTRKDHFINFSPNGIAYKNTKKTHCPQGHEYNEENTHINSYNGSRQCRVCKRVRDALRRQKIRNAARGADKLTNDVRAQLKEINK